VEDKRHKIVIDQRENISVDGVVEVISFDEESVVCETNMGSMVIRGRDLHIEKLNLEQGVLSIEGVVEALEYNEEGFAKASTASIFGRIFR